MVSKEDELHIACSRSAFDLPFMLPGLKYFIAIIECRKCASTISLEGTTEIHF